MPARTTAFTLLVLIAPACGRAPAPEPETATAHDTSPHWSYDGELGPAIWAQLSSAYATCGAGTAQSPIDIAGAFGESLPPVTFGYAPANVSIVNNGHTVQTNFEPGSFIEVEGERFELLQLHFHHPSEHVIEGRTFDVEMHLVHRHSNGRLLVIGVLLDDTLPENAAVTAALARLPQAEGIAFEQESDAAALLPDSRTYFTYDGSLTTPPCTEGVRWLVLTTPVGVSAAAVARFAELFPHNARPVQPLTGRTVRYSTSPQ